jgi:hypothetical protein
MAWFVTEVKELTENSEWYKAHDFEGSVSDDETWAPMWTRYVEAARPTHGARVGVSQYLGGIHILALANILQRPIIVLDAPDNMHLFEGFDGLGMYPPCRFTREQLIAANGRCLSPIMIAWKSHAHNHFVAVVPRKLSTMEDFSKTMTSDHSHGWISFARYNRDRRELESVGVLLDLVFTSTPTSRDTACSTVRTCLANLKKFVDNPGLNAKYCSIPLDNKHCKHDIISVKHALDLLLVLGFEEKTVANGEGEMKPHLTFTTNPVLAQGLIVSKHHDEMDALLSFFTHDGALRGVAYPGLGEVKLEEDMKRLFGVPKPFLFKDWRSAVGEYGDGERANSTCRGSAWSFGSGTSADALVTKIMERGRNNFNALERNRFGEWDSDMLRFLSTPELAATLMCPVCLNMVTWPVAQTEHLEIMRDSRDSDILPCQGCLRRGRFTQLSIKQTLYLQVLDMLKEAYSSTAQLWLCGNSNCHIVNFDTANQCHLCRTKRPEEAVTVDRILSDVKVESAPPLALKRPFSDLVKKDENSAKRLDVSDVGRVEEWEQVKSNSEIRDNLTKESLAWTCLECRNTTSSTADRCSACNDGLESFLEDIADLDADEIKHIELRRAFSAVVASTSKQVTSSDKDSTIDEGGMNGDAVPSMTRYVSTPVTGHEKNAARDCLSATAVEMEGLWRETILAIIGEFRDGAEHGLNSINFKLD